MFFPRRNDIIPMLLRSRVSSGRVLITELKTKQTTRWAEDEDIVLAREP